LLLPYTLAEGHLGNCVLEVASKANAKVVAYFKSLHDEGYGLSTEKKRRSFRSVIKSLISRESAKPSKKTHAKWWCVPVQRVDAFLAFNREHRGILKQKLPGKKIVIAGYPLMYPEWKELCEKSDYVKKFKADPVFDIVVFTRGETVGRPPEENVVTNEMLERLLRHVFEKSVLPDPEKFRIRIKPHPLQDESSLVKMTSSLDNVSISYAPPSFLCASADLVVATYSSTVIDALIFGVPAIEYFEENEFFKKKHPTGSPFPSLGAMKARSAKQFYSRFNQTLSGDSPSSVISKRLGHKNRPRVIESI
jgi:hypothetical protein